MPRWLYPLKLISIHNTIIFWVIVLDKDKKRITFGIWTGAVFLEDHTVTSHDQSSFISGGTCCLYESLNDLLQFVIYYIFQRRFCNTKLKLNQTLHHTIKWYSNKTLKYLLCICYNSKLGMFCMTCSNAWLYHFAKISDKWWFHRIWLRHIVTWTYVCMKADYTSHVLTLLLSKPIVKIFLTNCCHAINVIHCRVLSFDIVWTYNQLIFQFSRWIGQQ